MKPSLLVMAAGMGSRFGGLKQLASVGPNGATLLDYSIHDALQAGFGRVVYIIRKDLEKDFRQIVGSKWEKTVPVDYVFQELSLLPTGFTVPSGRTKPWGTGHAIWAAKDALEEPFAALNADDYYGPNSFKILSGFLSSIPDPHENHFCMVGFRLDQTLSEFGPVARGVCEVKPDGYLKGVAEHLKIEREGQDIRFLEDDGKPGLLQGTETVSMNLWGFTPALFPFLEKGLTAFLKARGGEEKSEYLIPREVDSLLRSGHARVKVLPTDDPWFGMTYPEDLPAVKNRIQKMLAQGDYPEKLW